MNRLLIVVFVLLASAVHAPVIPRADVPEPQKPEVEHLLAFVRTSPCLFERNGKTYDGERAARHIREKYDYFRDKITSTEMFIEYSATKSVISGKYYLVHCGDERPVRTSDWLLEELERLRGGSGGN